MQKFLSTVNFSILADRMISIGKRVIAPKLCAGTLLYAPLGSSSEIITDKLPKRSAKETFFPVCEDILEYSSIDGEMVVKNPSTESIPETVLFGVRSCDCAAIPVLDAVFSWDYKDSFFLERRKKTTIMALSCSAADDACFCTAVGISPDDPKGADIFLSPLKGGGYLCDFLTEKGGTLLNEFSDLFSDPTGGEPIPPAKPQIENIDLEKVRKWLEANFENPCWDSIATRCVGCGACAFVCPVCHCFDIVDEGVEKLGKRRKCWDACGFWKFTHHASGHNPRDLQPKRYRNRIMHKFKYYHDKFGETLCTGCGRCIRICPVGIDIAEIVQDISMKKDA